MKTTKAWIKPVMVCLALSLLTACGGGSQGLRPDVDVEQQKGMALYQSGDYFNAVQWLERSYQKSAQKSVILALIDAYSQIGEEIKIYPLLNHALLTGSAEKTVITAQLAHSEGDCNEVIGLLTELSGETMAVDWQARRVKILAECESQKHQPLLAAAHYFQLQNLYQMLINEAAHDVIQDATPESAQETLIKETQEAMVYQLMLVNDTALIKGISQVQDPLWHGWLEAAFVDFGADGESGAHWLTQWENHPAAIYFLDSNAISSRQKVAVLLPFSGRFEKVAKAVQKGILAAAISQGSRDELQFFDTGSQGEAVASALFSAQEADVDMIVGPLDKLSITALESLPEPTVPVLLLNQSESAHHQFTLSPEAEAEDVAEIMYKQGMRQILILSSNDPWGERMTLAFAQRFADMGGQIISNHYFATDQADYSVQLRQILGLVGSRLRSKNLQQYLKLPVASEEVVRADIDAIFLAAQPSFARMMVPQLKFHHAAKVPVYATSHVFVGFDDSQHNKDLEGVHFPVAPLLLQTGDLLETLPFDVGQIKNTDLNLFAFGFDAMQLTSRLSWLGRVNTGQFSGLSGALSMDFDGNIRRHLLWAYYTGGEIFAAED